MSHVFTYWEGTPYAFTQACLNSITSIFGSSHIHLTPDSIENYIALNSDIKNCKHISFKSDYIRTMLLACYGGWWFDCDVLLFKNPQGLIKENRPHIWNLIYRVDGEWVPLINNGILYSPKGSDWITAIAEDFKKVDAKGLVLYYENEDIGQNIYEKHSVGNPNVVIGCEYDFNSRFNVDADYQPFWDGRIQLDSANYGIHIGASLSRWAAADGNLQASDILSITSLDELVHKFPKSVISQYLNRLS